MNLRTRLLALLLAAAMAFSLAACADSGIKQGSADPDVSPSVSGGTPIDVDTGVEDLWLATAGIPRDFELLTIDGEPVEAQFYLYWLVSSIAYMEQYFLYLFGEEVDWSDSTFTKSCQDDAMNATEYYVTIVAKAKELGLELTQEQLDELEDSLAQAAEGVGGDEAFADELRKVGLDYDTYYILNATYYYYELLRGNLYAETPSDEELDILGAKHILLMTVDPDTQESLDDETIAEKRAQAEDLLSQLQAVEGEEQLALFDELMNEYSEDTGLATNPDGYLFTAEDMVAEFEDATRALEFGQIGDVVESKWGYHIILRLDPNDHPDIEETRTEFVYDLVDQQIDAWIEEAEITYSDEYQNLDIQALYEGYSAYQEAFIEESKATE